MLNEPCVCLVDRAKTVGKRPETCLEVETAKICDGHTGRSNPQGRRPRPNQTCTKDLHRRSRQQTAGQCQTKEPPVMPRWSCRQNHSEENPVLPRWSCRQNHPEEKGPAAARRSPEGHWLPRVPDKPLATHVKGHNLTACEPPIRSPDGWEEEGMGMRSHGQVVPGLELLRESILGAYEVTREAGGRGGAFQNMTVSDTGERTFEHWWEPSIVLRGGGAFLSRFQSSGGKALLRRLRGGGALHRNLGLLGLGNGWQHTGVCTGRQRAKVADQRIPRSKR